MADDPTLPCPECLTGEPHTDPSEPHIHFTPYGYVLYSPDHPRPGFLEEIRAVAHRAGRDEAAQAIRDHADVLADGALPGVWRRALLAAARVAAPKPTPTQIAAALVADLPECVLDDAGRPVDPQQKGTGNG